MLKDKNIVITGAKGAIGRETCNMLAGNGANIWACMRKQDAETERYLSKISERYSVWIKPVYIELGNRSSMDEGINKILGEKLPIDVLINNAAVAKFGLANLTSIETVREVFEVNFFSQLYITEKISRRMIRNKRGNIINIASVSALENEAGRLAYGGSKAALIYMTKTLANEYKSFGIRVNAIAPGPVETDMMKNYTDEQIEECRALSYDGRVANPEDVANLICFLSSDRSEHINGQVIRIDGGI